MWKRIHLWQMSLAQKNVYGWKTILRVGGLLERKMAQPQWVNFLHLPFFKWFDLSMLEKNADLFIACICCKFGMVTNSLKNLWVGWLFATTIVRFLFLTTLFAVLYVISKINFMVSYQSFNFFIFLFLNQAGFSYFLLLYVAWKQCTLCEMVRWQFTVVNWQWSSWHICTRGTTWSITPFSQTWKGDVFPCLTWFV